MIPLFITAMLAGRQPVIYGDGRQSRDFTFVANVVHGNLLAADAEPSVAGRTINVANGRSDQPAGADRRAQSAAGHATCSRVHAPPRVGDVRESLADITLARRLLGYEPQVDFEEGLRRSIDYYRQIVEESSRSRARRQDTLRLFGPPSPK